MSVLQQINRDALITEFWDSVRRRLISHYDKSPKAADLGIEQYREDTQRHGISEVLYNQGVEHTAWVVNGVIEHGLPKLTLGESDVESPV